jgi:hypothetical protein
MIFFNLNKLRLMRNFILCSANRGYGSLGSPVPLDYRLNPWFVTGFTDAEGCFYVGIGKSNRIKTG